jgi:hypothetical protein
MNPGKNGREVVFGEIKIMNEFKVVLSMWWSSMIKLKG